MYANKKVLVKYLEAAKAAKVSFEEAKNAAIDAGYKFKIDGELYDEFSLGQLVWLVNNHKSDNSSGKIPEF